MDSLGGGELFAGKYRVEAVLGQGGMGVVLAARHVRLDEPVAIKVLLPEMKDAPGMVGRFLREAWALAKLKSEHVVRVTDVDTLPSGLPFMVMERLEGLDLATLCKQKSVLGIAEAVGYVIDACDGLAEAHARGIVHRDIKPGNLFLARRPGGGTCVKVLDFGVSKLPPHGEHDETAVGMSLGSPSYMSPEQMRSAHDVDARTDIWALGTVLYRLLTGVAPFRAESIPKLYALVADAKPQRAVELRPDIPADLDAVLVRCLSKDPALRFSSAPELARALLPFAGEGARAPVERASVPIEPVVGLGSAESVPARISSDKGTGFETSVSAVPSTGPVPARIAFETPASTATVGPSRGPRGTVRNVAIAGVLAVVAATLGIRLSVRSDRASGSDGAPADSATSREIATDEPHAAPAEPPPPAPIHTAAAMASAGPVLVTAAATAVASAAAPPKLWGRIPPREPVEKKPPAPAEPANDPFRGTRK